MKVRGDQGDLSSAFQFPHPNKSESILQRGLFIVLYFLSSSSIAAHQQHRFMPYGGRLSLTLAVALGGIPMWRQQSHTPFADPLKAHPDCHLKNIKRKKENNADILRQLSDCQQAFSSSISCLHHVPSLRLRRSQSPMVSTRSAVIHLLTVWLCIISKLCITLNSSHWLSCGLGVRLLEWVSRAHLMKSDWTSAPPLTLDC